MNETRQNILVTGGAGFIGSNLVIHLLEQSGCRVINLDKLTYAGNPASLGSHLHHPRHHFVHGDIADPAMLSDVFQRFHPDAVIHLADDYGCYVGELVTVGHSAILHACTVNDEVLIGMGAIVLDGAVIGERSIIGAGALVTGGTIIPPGSLVLGSPGKVVKNLSLDEQSKIKSWAEKYVTGSRIYRENHSTLP
jgi:UDP-3-O-[3-hydroxymyristoyl] glucosamine N-acyltransferase